MSRVQQAPSATVPQVDPRQMREKIVQDAQTIQTSAELVDAMVFSLELMMAEQKQLMQNERVGSFLMDNELWDAMSTLTAAVRTHMHDVGRLGEAIECARTINEEALA